VSKHDIRHKNIQNSRRNWCLICWKCFIYGLFRKD